MKKSRFTDQQIAFALSQFETATVGGFRNGPTVKSTPPPRCGWRDWYGQLRASPRRDPQSETRKMKYLEEQNAKLNQLVFDLHIALGGVGSNWRKRH